MIAVASVVIVAGCSSQLGNPSLAAPTATAATITGPSTTVALKAVGASGVSGTATLTAAGSGQTRVVVTVEANLNNDMPTFITPGSCTSIDKSKLIPLNDTRNGTATSMIPVALADLLASPYELHLDFSPDVASIAACGAIS